MKEYLLLIMFTMSIMAFITGVVRNNEHMLTQSSVWTAATLLLYGLQE